MLLQKKIMNPTSIPGSSSPLVFENCVFDGRGMGDVYLLIISNYTGAITIKNCVFRNNETTSKQAVFISNSTDFKIENCIFENCFKPIGIWNSLNLTKAEIIQNRFKDFKDNCVQFFNCRGGGIRVNDNRFFQSSSSAYSIDVINFYDFAGLISDYAQINRNWGRLVIPTASYPTDYTGAFIVIGDGASFDTQYIDCDDNISVDCTAVGYQVVSFAPAVTRNVNFRRNRSYNQLRNDSVKGKSSVGLQAEINAANDNILSGNAHYCIRARFAGIESSDPDNDIFPARTTSEALPRPAWLTPDILSNNCFA